jgi:hypothetical protein
MTRLRVAAAIAAAALIVSACSSSGSTPVAASGAPASEPAAASGSAAATSGSAAATDTFVMPAAGSGSCTVNITGAVTASWTAKQNAGTLLVSQWVSASQLAVLGMTPADEAFIFNCKADAGAIDFTSTAGTTVDQIPVAPAEYVIPAAGLTDHNPGQLAVLISLHDGNLWRVAQDGSFKITTFGGSKFAGSFQFDISSDAGAATVSGTFEESCTGDNCS